ncbi:MAG: hypothetical protein QM496_16590, partial [Verrucomicrobiota bacterium]
QAGQSYEEAVLTMRDRAVAVAEGERTRALASDLRRTEQRIAHLDVDSRREAILAAKREMKKRNNQIEL